MAMSIRAPQGRHYKAILSFAFLLSTTPAAGQSDTQDAPYRLRTRADLVDVAVSVTDARGNFLANLRRENFRILDEGVEQPIAHFEAVELPVMVVVVLETSPAVYLLHAQHIEAARALADGLAPEDQVALVTYDLAPRMVLSLTTDKGAFVAALLRLHYNLGMAQLNLFDSLSKSLDWLAQVPGKKAVVLLSTGLDSFDSGRWLALEGKLRASDVVIYPIALGGSLRQPRKSPPGGLGNDVAAMSFEAADRTLNSLAALTGGRAHFPLAADEFPAIYQQIARALRHQYRIGFRPAARDGKYHSIEVQLLDDKGRVSQQQSAKSSRRIHARRGYLSPAS